MTWETNIQNLVKIGAGKITRRDEAVIHQRLADAEAFLTDARNVTTTQSRFLLTIEGVRQVGLAVANHAGIKVIPNAQHKVDVSQLAAMITQLETVVPVLQRPWEISAIFAYNGRACRLPHRSRRNKQPRQWISWSSFSPAPRF
ncbi:hypothetical protein [Phyllobacterium sp. P5_D12]